MQKTLRWQTPKRMETEIKKEKNNQRYVHETTILITKMILLISITVACFHPF